MNDESAFVKGTEAYLAAVWYVMKDAERAYERNRSNVERGRMSPWAYLTKVRRVLKLGPQPASYSVMRQELMEFAATFGVSASHPRPQPSPADQAAIKEFS